MQIEALVEQSMAGDRRALARLLSLVEDQGEEVDKVLTALFPHTGHAMIVGVTGAPGTGKSTLVSALAQAYRQSTCSVGIIAIDPSSPFSGGAILGDRIRMRNLAGDPGIFIRSMATRGQLGGLALATRDVLHVMDAASFDIILVETVGAGQSEIEIARLAQTVIVVEAPGMGDGVQAIKAGLLEIADVLVLNKADRPGARAARHALQAVLESGYPLARNRLAGRLMQAKGNPVETPMWLPPLIETVALRGEGIAAVTSAVEAHQRYLTDSDLRERLAEQQIDLELYERLQVVLMERLQRALPVPVLDDIMARMRARTLAPQAAVREILSALEAGNGMP